MELSFFRFLAFSSGSGSNPGGPTNFPANKFLLLHGLHRFRGC
jgi:hypothetical protein